jgi:hypothetical protein
LPVEVVADGELTHFTLEGRRRRPFIISFVRGSRCFVWLDGRTPVHFDVEFGGLVDELHNG